MINPNILNPNTLRSIFKPRNLAFFAFAVMEAACTHSKPAVPTPTLVPLPVEQTATAQAQLPTQLATMEIPTLIPTWTPTDAPTNTPRNTATATATNTYTATFTSTRTETPTATPTNTPTDLPTNMPTDTLTATATNTLTSTSTPTQTPTETSSPTNMPTDTETPTGTSTPTDLPTNMPTDTLTATVTQTANVEDTAIAEARKTINAAQTRTPTTTTPTATPTVDIASSIAAAQQTIDAATALAPAPTNTPTNTPTDLPTNTPTDTLTATATNTLTSTSTPTQTITGSATPPSPPTYTPTETVTLTSTPTPSETPAPQENFKTKLEQLGIRVSIPANAEWMLYGYDGIADYLRASGLTIQPGQMTAIIETDTNGNKVWEGKFVMEPPFAGDPPYMFQPGVIYDEANGYHVDQSTGKPVFDPEKIFLKWEDLPEGVQHNFADRLVNIKLNLGGMAVFARTGGVTKDGNPAHTHYFAGTKDVEIDGVEQITVLPVNPDLCPENGQKAAAIRAWQQAALEFVDNQHVRDGFVDADGTRKFVTVRWFDPDKREFVTLDGRMISKLSQEAHMIQDEALRNDALETIRHWILEKVPSGSPLSPEEAAQRFGGKAENWVSGFTFDKNGDGSSKATGEWFYEAYNRKAQYVDGVGHVGANGNLLTGAKQADRETTEVFDFNVLDEAALVSIVHAPGKLPVNVFARMGPARGNISYYFSLDGEINDDTVPQGTKAIEQMVVAPMNISGCPLKDIPKRLVARSQKLAEDQPDHTVTSYWWDNVAQIWIEIKKTSMDDFRAKTNAMNADQMKKLRGDTNTSRITASRAQNVFSWNGPTKGV